MLNRPKAVQAPTIAHQDFPPQLFGPALRLGQQIDDASEQDRLDEECGGQCHVGHRQGPTQTRFRPEQFENSEVKT